MPILEVSNNIPLRELHNLTAELYQNQIMVMIGGEPWAQCNELLFFDLMTQKLRVFCWDSAKFTRFDSHASCLIGHTLLVFGGQWADLKSKQNEMVKIDLKTMQVDQLQYHEASEVPPGRKHHSMIWDPSQKRILMFGGMKDDPMSAKKAVFQDCWAFIPQSMKWTRLPKGKRMLHGHTAVYDSIEQRMLVFGGCNHVGEYENDLYEYIFKEDRWRKVECDGQKPPGRERHTCHFIPEHNQMLVYGGWSLGGAKSDMYLLNLDTLVWKKLLWKQEYAREARFGHGSVYRNGKLYLFGGKNDFFQTIDTIEVLEVNDVEEEEPREASFFRKRKNDPFLMFMDEQAKVQYIQEHEKKFGKGPLSGYSQEKIKKTPTKQQSPQRQYKSNRDTPGKSSPSLRNSPSARNSPSLSSSSGKKGKLPTLGSNQKRRSRSGLNHEASGGSQGTPIKSSPAREKRSSRKSPKANRRSSRILNL